MLKRTGKIHTTKTELYVLQSVMLESSMMFQKKKWNSKHGVIQALSDCFGTRYAVPILNSSCFF